MGTMRKLLESDNYAEFVGWLKRARDDQSIGMRELAERLGRPHSYVAKIEGKARRLDVCEYVEYCEALGIEPCEDLKFLVG